MQQPAILVQAIAVDRWRVQVQATTPTSHDVTIPPGYLAELGVASQSPEKALEASFRFLLEREPNTAILRSFALPLIARYFPEYEREIAPRVRAAGA